MNDMINYLTTKNRLLVAILAFILPFSFAKAEVKEDGKTISQGWYVGIDGWRSDESGENYSNSPDHVRRTFLRKIFKSIKCGRYKH